MNLLDLIANGGADLANALGASMPTPDVTDAAKNGIYGVRGIRNNNPGNLQTNVHWDGMVPGKDSRFASFSDPQHGIQALTQNLIAKPKLHGLTTVNDIIGDPKWGWAPPNENDSKAYAAFVAGKLGISPDTQLPISFFQNPVTMQQMAGAIISKENGQNPYSPQQMTQGVNAGIQAAWKNNPTVQAQFAGLPQIHNQPGVVGGGNLPPPRNIGGQGPLTGINGAIQSIVKPPVQEVANTLAGNDTATNRAVGAPFKAGVDQVNDLTSQAVNSAMDTFKGQPTWPNNFLTGLIGGQVQGINNSLSNALTPVVQPAAQAEQNGMGSMIGGINKGLSGIAQTLSQGDQQARQMAQQELQTNAQAAAAARQKAAQVANVVANGVTSSAQAAPMPAGATPQGTPGAGLNAPQAAAQPQPAGAAAADGPLSDSEAAQYLSMPVDQNAPPAALKGAMGVNQLPTLANSQQGAMGKFNNFMAGAKHEIGDKVSGIEQLAQEFQGNPQQAQQIAADRARQNDAFQITTGQQPGVNLLNPMQNPGGWAADVGMGGPLVAGIGSAVAPIARMAIQNPMKTLGYGYAATHLNSIQGLLHLLSTMGAGGAGGVP